MEKYIDDMHPYTLFISKQLIERTIAASDIICLFVSVAKTCIGLSIS